MYQQKQGTVTDADKRAVLLKKYKEKLSYSEVLPLVSKDMIIRDPEKSETPVLGTHKSLQGNLLKLRILLASILFISILVLGGDGQIIGKIGISELKEMIGKTVDIGFLSNVFDFMEGFTYTLNDL